MTDLLSIDFMQRALIAALLVGTVAPMVGIFLVQRRLSLIGDGMGHVALAGVAIGLVTGAAPVLDRPRRRRHRGGRHRAAPRPGPHQRRRRARRHLLRRHRRRRRHHQQVARRHAGQPHEVPLRLDPHDAARATSTSSPGSPSSSPSTTWALRPRLFAVANDEEYARAVGIPVLPLNIVLAVLTATTVVVAMRVVGLLLISALMIVPNAASQLVARSFSGGLRWAIAFGLVVVGRRRRAVLPAQHARPGGTIVLLAVGALRRHRGRHRRCARASRGGGTTSPRCTPHEHGVECGHPAIPHGDHVDYVHDGHLHAAHEGHYDEHGHGAAPPRPGERSTSATTGTTR